MERQLIPLYLILAFIGFRMLMAVFYPFFVLIHELGHAIPAQLSGKKEVKIAIGKGPEVVAFSFLGIQFSFAGNKLHLGYTVFKKNPGDGRLTQCFIIGTAPVISLTIAIAGVFLWKAVPFSTATYFVLASAWLANLHITFNALWPEGGKYTSAESENNDNYCYRSDLRNLLDVLRGNSE